MPSSKLSTVLSAVRVGSVVVGIGVAVLTVLRLAAMPPPPPGSDGFAPGSAAIIGGGIVIVSLSLVTVSVVLPTLLGRDDSLGFTGWQRRALQAAGGLIAGGLILGLAYGVFTGFLNGIVLWFWFLLLSAAIVTAILAWRLGEVLVQRLTPIGTGEVL